MYYRLLSALYLLICPAIALAQSRQIVVGIGTTENIFQIVERIITIATITIGALCTIAFIVGGFLIVLSRGQDPLLSRGKQLMIDSLIGMAVVLSAQGILRIVVGIIYSPA